MRKLFTLSLFVLFIDSRAQDSIPKSKSVSTSTYSVTERSGYDQDVIPFESSEIIWKGQVSINGLSKSDLSLKLIQWGNQKGFKLNEKRTNTDFIVFNGTFKVSKGSSKEYICNNAICFFLANDGYKYEIKNVYLTRYRLEFFYYNHDEELKKSLETAFKNINTEMIKLGKEIQMIF